MKAKFIPIIILCIIVAIGATIKKKVSNHGM
jgi:hypothetical protein